MKNHHLVLLCFAFISIFSTRTSCEENKVNIYTKHGSASDIIHYTVKKSIELRCNTSETGGQVTWQKGGKSVEDIGNLKDRVEVSTEASSGTHILTIKNMQEGDNGNYTCVFESDGRKLFDWVTLTQDTKTTQGVKVKNTNVVEGEKLSLKCQVRGISAVEWDYKNATRGDENWTRITEKEERFKLQPYFDDDERKNITNGFLVIEETDMGDRGDYKCTGEADDGTIYNSTATVRIKDKYAALWPFLGICAEVFVLCAIIFIYEKKRNKTELEESDTDQSPDQKNTPDHGKESNLRHRQ